MTQSEKLHFESAIRKKNLELKRSWELLKATIDSSMDMIQVFKAVRDQKGRIVDFIWLLNNKAAEKKHGDVIGKSLLKLNPGVIEEGIFDTFIKVVETGEPDQTERHYVHEQFNGWYCQSTVKQDDGVATTTSNITSRKKAEEEIIRLKDEIAKKATDKYTRSEEQLRTSEKKLKELNENLEQLVQKRTNELIRLKLDQEKEKLNTIVFTQEQERARISEGLHDSVAQLLYAAQNRIQMLKEDWGNNNKELNVINDILAEAIDDTRRISFELMPPVLRDYGLEVSLKLLMQKIVGKRLELDYDVSIKGRLAENLEITIYRIVQEMVNNILKHSQAKKAWLYIKVPDKYVHLKVADNGLGFTPKKLKDSDIGIGLQSIRNRVRLLNGKMQINSEPGKGTSIELRIPLKQK